MHHRRILALKRWCKGNSAPLLWNLVLDQARIQRKNLIIHDFKAMTFSVELAIFREKYALMEVT